MHVSRGGSEYRESILKALKEYSEIADSDIGKVSQSLEDAERVLQVEYRVSRLPAGVCPEETLSGLSIQMLSD